MTADLNVGATPIPEILQAIDELADLLIVQAIGVETGGAAIRALVREAAATLTRMQSVEAP